MVLAGVLQERDLVVEGLIAPSGSSRRWIYGGGKGEPPTSVLTGPINNSWTYVAQNSLRRVRARAISAHVATDGLGDIVD